MLKFPQNKDPSSELDYICDWSNWLKDGDTIVSSWWDLPLDLQNNGDAFNQTVATIWIDGGEDGVTYVLRNHITTAEGREVERSIKLKIRNK